MLCIEGYLLTRPYLTQATDTVSGSGSEGNTYLEQAQEALGNAAQQAQETLGQVVEQAKEALGYGEQPPSM